MRRLVFAIVPFALLAQAPNAVAPAQKFPDITVMVNKSVVIEESGGMRRISVGNSDIAEAVAASGHELLLNGKTPGDTSLLVWDAKGNRLSYEVHVTASTSKIEAVTAELSKEVPGVTASIEDGNVFLRGTVPNPTAADRAFNIASTLGKVVNLLRVSVGPTEPQILLKVRFADIDRSAALQVGMNIFSMEPYKGIASSSTGQFGAAPTFTLNQTPGQQSLTWNVSQLLNLFYFNPQINVGAMLQDLQARNVLQILAEPNLLAVSGHPASFLAGGEFPFPTLQGGAAGVGQITIQFKEFGIRLNFLPTFTPRGTIRLVVTPEVSSLDYSNGLTISGFTIPGLATRRVQTEVELQNGQSFVIAGLLDNQVTEQFNRMPGIGSIPVIGKLFQSKSVNRSNNELLVVVTPELVGPIPQGTKPPELNFPTHFYEGSDAHAPQTPGPAVTGPLPALPHTDSVPIEQLKNTAQNGSGASPANSGPALGLTPILALQPMPQNTPAPGQPNSPPNQ